MSHKLNQAIIINITAENNGEKMDENIFNQTEKLRRMNKLHIIWNHSYKFKSQEY